MRPLRLEMQAFGPFAASEMVAFEELGDKPLFLINGSTGAGKTTILDAICFALYGETTGNERSAKEMRCDHAEATVLTRISLVFELAGKQYRILRIPEQQRPKKSGDGYTAQKPTAELHQLTPEGEEILLVSSRVSEANRYIIDLTGLSAEQFRQVMVLPQGKFRELLLADSENREKIFRQLFQTQLYSRLERRLKEQANSIAREVQALEHQQQGILVGVDMPNASALELALAELEQQSIALQAQRQRAEKQHAESIQLVTQGRQLEQQFSALDAATKAHAALLQQRELYNGRTQQKQEAERAGALQPAYLALRNLRGARDLARQKRELAEAEAERAQQRAIQCEAAHLAAEQQQPLLEQYQQQLRLLEGYRERSRQLAQADAVLAAAEQSFRLADADHARQRQRVLEGQQQQAQLEQALQRYAEANTRLPGLQQQFEQLDQLLALRQKLLQSQTALQQRQQDQAALQAKLSRSESVLQRHIRQRSVLEQTWKQGQAAVLADQLCDGSECPVCGSKEHPNPASPAQALPTEAELQNAVNEESLLRERKDVAAAAVLQGEADIRSGQQQIDEMLQELGDFAVQPLEAQQSHLQQLTLELEACRESAGRYAGCQQQLLRAKQEITAAETQLDTLAEQRNNTGNALAAARADAANKAAELPQEYRLPARLEEAIDQLEKGISELQQQISSAQAAYQQARVQRASARAGSKAALEAEQLAETAYAGEQAQWQRQLQDSVFTDEQAFLQAMLEPEALAALTSAISEYETALLAAEIALQQAQAAVSRQQRPDLAALQRAEQQHGAALREAEAAFHQAHERHNQLLDARQKLQQAARSIAKQEQQYGVVGKLSDVANGANSQNLSLQRFVLSVALDDVLLSAGQRLQNMSKGRYRLLRKTEVGDRRSKSGLDLEVEDAYSGKRRPVATLSGGESFMAALALALGLSEVVQSYAGGIRLDTLFVDEGFGSLDPESLDLAINTLIDLQASGRMVGVISHVPELKERLDVRLDVLADHHGSRTRLVKP